MWLFWEYVIILWVWRVMDEITHSYKLSRRTAVFRLGNWDPVVSLTRWVRTLVPTLTQSQQSVWTYNALHPCVCGGVHTRVSFVLWEGPEMVTNCVSLLQAYRPAGYMGGDLLGEGTPGSQRRLGIPQQFICKQENREAGGLAPSWAIKICSEQIIQFLQQPKCRENKEARLIYEYRFRR